MEVICTHMAAGMDGSGIHMDAQKNAYVHALDVRILKI